MSFFCDPVIQTDSCAQEEETEEKEDALILKLQDSYHITYNPKQQSVGSNQGCNLFFKGLKYPEYETINTYSL